MADKHSPWVVEGTAEPESVVVVPSADEKDRLVLRIVEDGVRAFTDHADMLGESDTFTVTMTALDNITALVISAFVHGNEDCARMVVDQHADNTMRFLEHSLRRKGH